MRNIGNATANCGSICNQEVDFFLDGSKLPGDGNYDNLAAGSSVIVQSRSYTAPAAGTHNFRALADADGDISESNDRNNDRSENLTVAQAPKPDLIVEDIWLDPTTPTEGSSYRIKARVRNIGNAAANCGSICNQEVDFFLDGSKLPGDGNYDNLAAGSSVIVQSRSYTAPAASTHNFRALADADGDISESNDRNNDRSENLTVAQAPKPDLIVEDIWLEPASPVEGTSYRVKARVKNIGEARATCPGTCNQEIFFYVNNVNVGEDNYDNLDPNQIITLESPRLTAPSAGSHAIRAKADANNEVPESRESNNELSEPFTTNPVTYTLKTFTDTEATVYLNGSQIGVTSRRTACNLFTAICLQLDGLSAGSYSVRVSASGRDDATTIVNLSSNQDINLPLQLTRLSGELSISPPPPFDISLSNNRVSVVARNTGNRQAKFFLEVRGVPTGWSVEDANFGELDPGTTAERSVEVQGPLTGGAFDATFVLRACANNFLICLDWTDVASATYRFTAQPRQVTRLFTGVSSEVLIDGVSVGTSSRDLKCNLFTGVCLDFDAAPGVHEVWVRAVENGFNDAKSRIDLTENSRIALTPIPQDLEEKCSDWSADIQIEPTEVNLALSTESLAINPSGTFTVQPAFTLQPSLRLCITMANGQVHRMSVEGNLVESASLTLIANGALTWRGDHELYGTYLSPFFFGPVLIVPHARVFLRGEVGFEGETTLVTRQNLTSTVRLLYDGGWRDDGSGFSCSGVAVRIEDIGSQCVDTENASLLRGKAGLSIWGEVALEVFALGGPAIRLGAGAEVEGGISQDEPWWTVCANIEAEVAFRGNPSIFGNRLGVEVSFGPEISMLIPQFSSEGTTECGYPPLFTSAPTPTANIEIQHTYRGDLVVRIGAGSPSSPSWERTIHNRSGGGTNDLDLTVDLSDAAGFLPPSEEQRWFLEVRDQAGGDAGQIQIFEITHDGSTYRADLVPVPITDFQTSTTFIPSTGPDYSLEISISGQGTVIADPSGPEYPLGTTVALVPQATEGWQFLRWEGDLTGSSVPGVLTMDSSKSVLAVFVIVDTVVPTLRLAVEGEGTVIVDPPGPEYVLGSVVSLVPQATEGWQFLRWEGDLTGLSVPGVLIMDSNKSVLAVFEEVVIDPTSSARVGIQHTYRGDLVVRIGAGSPSSPSWERTIHNRSGGGTNDLDLTVDLSDPAGTVWGAAQR